MKIMKRILVVLALAACMLALSSCGRGGEEERERDNSKKYQKDQEKKSDKKTAEKENASETKPDGKKKNDPELIWYDGEYCTAFCYKGEGAERFISMVEGGVLPFLSITIGGDNGYFDIQKCVYSGDHLTFGYGSAGRLQTGKCCEHFKEEYYHDHGCQNDFEIRCEYGDGEVWFCVYNKANGPKLMEDKLPDIQISVSDPDNYSETSFEDSFGAKKQEYRTDVPERFLEKAVEIENLSSLADFPFADVSMAKTDDYFLHMSNDKLIEMLSFDSDGKCVYCTEFSINTPTGEVEVREFVPTGFDPKYTEICSYASTGSIQAHPSYFSRPYLTPQQFQSMYNK